jgi:hypothetical protein
LTAALFNFATSAWTFSIAADIVAAAVFGGILFLAS